MAHNARWLAVWIAALAVALVFPSANGADGSWAAPSNLSSSVSDTVAASIARDAAGRVHAVWAEGDLIYHRVQMGGVWGASVAALEGESPRLAADAAGGVHLVFTRESDGAEDVYYASWAPGAGWSLPVNISESDADSLTPYIAAGAGQRLFIVWTEVYTDVGLIYGAESDGGDAWTSAPIPNAQGGQPTVILTVANAPIVAWQDVFDLGFPLDIYASQRTGDFWSLPVNVSYSTLGEATLLYDSSSPALAMDAAGAALAWGESGEAGSAIWLARLGAEGWGDAVQATASDGPYGPALAFDAAGLGHLAWATANGASYRTWNPTSGGWGAVETIASAQDVSVVGLLAGDAPRAAWLAQAATDNRDLYYSQRSLASPTPAVTATPSRTPTVKPVFTPAACLYLPLLRKP